MIVIAFAALAALLTRRIVGGIMVGFLISIIEPNTYLLLIWFSQLFRTQDLVGLYRFTPSYNIGNIHTWMQWGKPLDLGFFPIEASLGFSLIVVGIWIVGMIGLVTLLFQRQDITT